MKKKSHKSGFTLIEIMISVAIIAIVFTATIKAMSAYQWMTRETYYSAAVRQMNAQKRIISDEPFDKLPPEILVIPEDGKIQLANGNLVPDSIRIIDLNELSKNTDPVPMNPSLYNVDFQKGLINVLDPGFKRKRVLVDYRFLLPDEGEAMTVPREAPYEIELFNSPAVSIEEIEMVENNKMTPVPLHKLKTWEGGGKISFDPEYAGKIIRVSYVGGIIRNICSGRFLDEDLNPSSKPTGIKLIGIKEVYGGKYELKTGVLKVKK